MRRIHTVGINLFKQTTLGMLLVVFSLFPYGIQGITLTDWSGISFGVNQSYANTGVSLAYTASGGSAVQNFEYTESVSNFGAFFAFPLGFHISADGLHYFVTTDDGGLIQYEFGSPYDFSTASDVKSDYPHPDYSGIVWSALTFNPDGTKLYNAYNDQISTYDMGTAFDVWTYSANGENLDVSNEGINTVADIMFNDDGTKLYLLESNSSIYQYSLGTAYDISTASFDGSVSVEDEVFQASGFTFADDGNTILVTDYDSYSIFTYDLSAPYDALSAVNVPEETLDVSSQVNYPPYFPRLSGDGTLLHVIEEDFEPLIYQYTLTTKYSESADNDGTIDNSNPATIIIDGDTFTGSNGSDLIADGKATVNNLPTGLTAVLTKDSDTQLTLTLDGTHPTHQPASDVASLSFTFNDTAFTNTSANSVGNATSYDAAIGVSFLENQSVPPGITLSSNASTAEENTGTSTFTVILDSEPTSNVVLTVSSDNTAEGTVSPETLTFTTGNYNTPQTVTVTGVDDNLVQDDSAIITVAVDDALSADEYDVLDDQTHTVTFTNDDSVGLLYDYPGAHEVTSFEYDNDYLVNNVAVQNEDSKGLYVTEDGSKMFVADYADIYEYNLGTAYDITSAVYERKGFVDNVRAFDFSPDGMTLFVAKNTDVIKSHTLSTPFDLEGDSENIEEFDVSGEVTEAIDMSFNDDGTKLYILDIGTDNFIHQYSLATAYDLSTGSYDGAGESLNLEDVLDSDAFGFAFTDWGFGLVVTEQDGNRVLGYTLTTAYEISTAVAVPEQVIDVSSDFTTPRHLHMNAEGTRLYLSGVETGTMQVNQYTFPFTYPESALTNNGSIDNSNPATITIDGDTFTGSNGSDLIADGKATVNNLPTGLTAVLTKDSDTQLTLTLEGTHPTHQPASDVASLSFTFNDTAFTNHGASLVENAVSYDASLGVSFLENPAELAYNVVNPYQVQDFDHNATYTANDVTNAGSNGVYVTEDGSKMFVAELYSGIYEHTLTTPHDLSTASYDDLLVTSVRAFDFSPDGTQLFVSGDFTVTSYTLGGAFDVSTAALDTGNLSISAASFPKDMKFNADGTAVYVLDSTDTIEHYTLGTAYDVSSGSYSGAALDISGEIGDGQGFNFADSGTLLLVTDTANNQVTTYALSTPTMYQPLPPFRDKH